MAIAKGTAVMLRSTDVLDEHGNRWTHGAGPFPVARIYHTPGYKRPWLRLLNGFGRVEEGTAVELPASFRESELRPATKRELEAFYGIGVL